MATTVYDGKNKVHFLPACADISAPTVAEITAGKNWTPYITRDGISVPNGENFVEDEDIEDVFDAQIPGTWGGQPLKLIMRRDDTDESDTYDFIEYGLAGFILISRFGPAVADARVEVYPVTAQHPTLMQSAKNEKQKFSSAWAVTSAPDTKATVVA